MIRLQKYLADCGVASRRTSEKFIQEGKVTINGKIVRDLGVKIDPQIDEVTCFNKPVKMLNKTFYIILNKPFGYVTSAKDQFGRKTVLDLIDVGARLYPVGRLDYDSTGLLLLTNDGDLTYKLTHPKHEIAKSYIVKVVGFPNYAIINKLAGGVKIDDYTTKPAKVRIVSRDKQYTTLQITIKEGKNRQVRKMCEAVGHKVATLTRASIGELKMGELEKGKYRHLTEEEVRYLKRL